MDWLTLGLQIITYFIVGIIAAKITLAVQEQIKTQNNEEPFDNETRLGIAGLVVPFWPVFLGLLCLYLVLALVMNIFSRLLRPLI